MIDPKFKDVKIGDWIWTIQQGWEKLIHTPANIPYVLATDRDAYTLDGKRYLANKYPSAWTYNPFDPEDKPPCEFKKGEIIAVRNIERNDWKYRIFNYILDSKTHNYRYKCFCSSWEYARKLTAEEKGL